MTFGEKLKKARKDAGMSQEQFSEKLTVSRSAVAKWEADKGLPDIDNLKAIAKLLNVSIDFLLDEEGMITLQEWKESIDLSQYEKTDRCRSKSDAVMLQKYGDAQEIIPLIREKKLSKIENILEWTILPGFGIFRFVDQVNHPDAWYLAERANRQYLVCVSKEFIISTELGKKITDKTFVIGDQKFTKVHYRLLG